LPQEVARYGKQRRGRLSGQGSSLLEVSGDQLVMEIRTTRTSSTMPRISFGVGILLRDSHERGSIGAVGYHADGTRRL
jgi:hypothetical protein